jgi:hypothetical protein
VCFSSWGADGPHGQTDGSIRASVLWRSYPHVESELASRPFSRIARYRAEGVSHRVTALLYFSNGKDAEREAMLPLTQNLFFSLQGKAAFPEALELIEAANA